MVKNTSKRSFNLFYCLLKAMLCLKPLKMVSSASSWSLGAYIRDSVLLLCLSNIWNVQHCGFNYPDPVGLISGLNNIVLWYDSCDLVMLLFFVKQLYAQTLTHHFSHQPLSCSERTTDIFNHSQLSVDIHMKCIASVTS